MSDDDTNWDGCMGEDLQLIMQQTDCDKEMALEALFKTNNDLAAAILWITDNEDVRIRTQKKPSGTQNTIEYKMSEEQYELCLEVITIYTKHCGSVFTPMSDHPPKDSVEKLMADSMRIKMLDHIITHEIESCRVIRDVATLYHIKQAFKYYRDLLEHTKYIFISIYKQDIPEYILAKEMLVHMNLFRINKELGFKY